MASIGPATGCTHTHPSILSKGGIQRFTQGRVAKWLEQAFYRTGFEQSCANRLVFLSGDKDDRNFFPAILQFLLEIRSCHSRHGDIEDEASGLVDVAGFEKLFRGREHKGCKAEQLGVSRVAIRA